MFPLPFSLNNACFYLHFTPTSKPFSLLLHTILVSSVSNVKYIYFALHQPVTSWQIALISIWVRCFFACNALLLLCSIHQDSFLWDHINSDLRLLCRCGEVLQITWTCAFQLQHPGGVNGFVHKSMTDVRCNTWNVQWIQPWTNSICLTNYMFSQSCSVPTSGVTGLGCPDRLIRQQFAYLPQSTYLVHMSGK